MKPEVGAGLLATAAAAGWWWHRRAAEKIPVNWVEVGAVEELLVYPLKSGAPIKCDSFECTKAGPVLGESRDRVLAIVREDGSLVTGRDFPLLTQISAEIKGGILTLSADNHPTLTVNVQSLPTTKRQYLKIWKSQSEGVDCGDDVAAWLHKYVGEKTRLLYNPERYQGKDVANALLELPFIRRDDGGIFSDAMSFLLLNKASTADLNSRLESPVIPRIFRQNILISGEKLVPYEEDSWEWVKIGDRVFRILAPCTRCLFTTVDPENGEKSATFEPLKTLRRYRILRGPTARKLFGLAPVMGQYLGLRSDDGPILVGDVVSVAVS